MEEGCLSPSGNHPDMMGPWRVGRSIGRNKGFRVRIVQHVETKVFAAVKIVPRPRKSLSPQTIYDTPTVSDRDLQDLEREIATMKLVTHPNLLALYDVWESKRELFLVTEYAAGGELCSHLQNDSTNLALYLRQILSAISHCHSLNITFHGFTTESIFLDESKKCVKLLCYESSRLETIATRLSRGIRKDIWSCGVVYLKFLRREFGTETDVDIWAKSASSTRRGTRPPVPDGVSQHAMDILEDMLGVRNRNCKPVSASDLLSHPFFADLAPEPANSLIRSSPVINRSKLTAKNVDFAIYKELLSLLHSNVSEEVIRLRLLQPEPSIEKTVYSLLANHRLKNICPRPVNTLRKNSPVLPSTQTRRTSDSSSDSNTTRPRNWLFSPQALFMRRSPQTQPLSPFSFISTPKKIGGSVIVGQTPSLEQSPAGTMKRRVSAPRPLQGSKLGGSGASGRSRLKGVNERQLVGLGILQDSSALNGPGSAAVDPKGAGSRAKGKKVHGSGTTRSHGAKHAHKENSGGRVNQQADPSTRQKTAKHADRASNPKSPHITFTSPVKPLRSPPTPVLRKPKSRRLLKSKPVQEYAVYDEPSPADAIRGTYMDDSLRHTNWLGAIMTSLRSSNPSLLSVLDVQATREECIRILEKLQVKAEPSLDQANMLNCELAEMPYTAGILDAPKFVRFRVEFSAISASSHLDAGFTSSLTLVKEKGSSSSFKLIYNHLRRDWELDNPISPNGNVTTMRLVPSPIIAMSNPVRPWSS